MTGWKVGGSRVSTFVCGINGIYNGRVVLGIMAHACNPSYSGHRDQEDLGLRPDQAKSS
jgi:hypothetical protein